MQTVDCKFKLLTELHFIYKHIILLFGRIMAFNVIIQSMVFL